MTLRLGAQGGRRTLSQVPYLLIHAGSGERKNCGQRLQRHSVDHEFLYALWLRVAVAHSFRRLRQLNPVEHLPSSFIGLNRVGRQLNSRETSAD